MEDSKRRREVRKEGEQEGGREEESEQNKEFAKTEIGARKVKIRSRWSQ